MDFKIEYPEKNVAVINIVVSKDDWAKDMEEAKAATQNDDANMNREYAISAAAGQALSQAITEDKLKLATAPTIIADDSDNGDVLITLTCQLLPEVKLGQYTGFGLKAEPAQVSDEEVLEEITRRINSQKLWENLPADTEAQNGDRVIIDFIGEKDGIPFEGGSASDYGLVLGSGTFIPGFEEQLVGTKAGETKDVTVTFPENYFEPSLAGQPVVFHVTIKAVQKEIEPKLDDAFIEKMELGGIKTVEEFKEKVKAEMLGLKEQEEENKVLSEILAKVSDGSEIDIPDAMIENRVDQMVEEYGANMQQYGMGIDQYLQMIGMTMDQFKEQLQPQAILELRQALILEAIAAKEDIQAEDNEIDEEYKLLSTIYSFPADQLKALIPVGSVATQIVQKKTLDFLKEKNTK